MCLTAFLNGSYHAEHREKANLQKTKVHATKISKVCVDTIKLCTKKEWRPNAQYSSLAVGQLLWSGRQAGIGKQNACSFTKYLKYGNFNSKVCLGCLNKFIAPIALYQ